MEQNSHFCRQFQVVKETRLIVGLTGINFQVGTGANFMAPGTVEIAIVVGLFFILFGPTQLPKLARSLGQAKTEFNRGLTEGGGESTTEADMERGGRTETVALTEDAASKGIDVEGKTVDEIKEEIESSETEE